MLWKWIEAKAELLSNEKQMHLALEKRKRRQGEALSGLQAQLEEPKERPSGKS